MVSYDVSALFTSIPIDTAIKVIRRRLEEDTTLPNRTELSPDQIIQLLQFCLETTYFVCKGTFYGQIRGAPMGSPVSPAVADLVMEDFEKKALNSSPVIPEVWYRYVDDTFTVLPSHSIDIFTQHINSIDSNIQFTIEPEADDKLPFLDICILKNEDGSLTTKVYRKPTHTNQYLNFTSNHHLEHKRSVVRTLFNRAETLVSRPEDKVKEIAHIKKVLTVNGYKRWAFHIPQKTERTKDKDSKGEQKSTKYPVCLPYVSGVTEKVQRIFGKYEVNSYLKPYNTLKSLLVRPKDKPQKEKMCGVVYQLECQDCSSRYVGETARALRTRFKEHTNSAIWQHVNETKHSFTLEEVKILDKEPKDLKRKIREALHIHRDRPDLNRDAGREIPANLLQLASRDLHGRGN